MRELIFRGKHLDNGEWVQGYYVCIGGERHYILTGKIVIEGCIAGFENLRVDPETVGQYTGLTDSNGKKIFEGDIVKRLFYFDLPVLSVVTFKNGAFGLEWNRGKVKEFSAFTSICNCTYEVIGNIYDNAELLGDI